MSTMNLITCFVLVCVLNQSNAYVITTTQASCAVPVTFAPITQAPTTTTTTTQASCAVPVTFAPVTQATTTQAGCAAPVTAPNYQAFGIPVTFPPINTFPPIVTSQPVTFPPVTFPPIPTTRPAILPDKKILIRNKGAYTSIMNLHYTRPSGEFIKQTGSILGGQAYAFCKKL